MRVLVCGSRDGWKRNDYYALLARIAALPDGTTILHGDARGPDRVAGALAEAFGFEVETWPADWARYGKRAGVVRNSEMVGSLPDLVIAMWNGTSRGTKDTIDRARNVHVPVEIIP